MVSVCEQRGDQKLLREIFRKNLWKYKKEDFLKNDLKKFGQRKIKEVDIASAFNR